MVYVKARYTVICAHTDSNFLHALPAWRDATAVTNHENNLIVITLSVSVNLFILQKCDTLSSIFPLDKGRIFVILLFARNPKIRQRASKIVIRWRIISRDFLTLILSNRDPSTLKLRHGEIFTTQEKRQYGGRVFPDKSSRCVRTTPSMPFCPLVFQGLTEQQKEFMEKQWAQQKEQFMGRQKSTYDLRFRDFKPELKVFKVLPALLEAPRYTHAHIFFSNKYN